MRFSRTLTSLALVVTLAACGGDDDSSTNSTTGGNASTVPGDGSAPSAPRYTKPEVNIPAQIPTELEVTTLVEGSGPEAAEGDQVVVHYVGVRSEDGAEFDNSYDGGQPFPVTLGQNSVIQGWELGLLGSRTGDQLQLDIPADLAYGDQPRGDVIQANDALTFVIDVVVVKATSNPEDEPEITLEPADPVADVIIVDLVDGEGDELTVGQNAVAHVVAFRADTGERINSTWTEGIALDFTVGAEQMISGLEDNIAGMKVGGRRQVTLPFLLAFGEGGAADFGLPPATDMVLVIDLIAIYQL